MKPPQLQAINTSPKLEEMKIPQCFQIRRNETSPTKLFAKSLCIRIDHQTHIRMYQTHLTDHWLGDATAPPPYSVARSHTHFNLPQVIPIWKRRLLKMRRKGFFTYNVPSEEDLFDIEAWKKIPCCVLYKGRLHNGYPYIDQVSPNILALCSTGKRRKVSLLAMLRICLDLDVPSVYGGPDSKEFSHLCEAYLKRHYKNFITAGRYSSNFIPFLKTPQLQAINTSPKLEEMKIPQCFQIRRNETSPTKGY